MWNTSVKCLIILQERIRLDQYKLSVIFYEKKSDLKTLKFCIKYVFWNFWRSKVNFCIGYCFVILF